MCTAVRFIHLRLGDWLLAMLVLATSMFPAHAARLALVIGNDQYQAVEKLKNAKNDANLMAGVLRKVGFEVTLANDLGREQLWSTLDIFKARIGKGDEVVFYFAGHGVQIGSTQLLLPTDIKAQTEGQVQRDGVPLVDIQDALSDARVAVFIIDACRDNPFPRQGTRSVGATRGLLPPDPSTGQIIMLSAGRNQKALDEVPNETTRNGLFTWELAQAIQTPGLEIRTVLEQVKSAVDDRAKRAGHEQRPSLVNDLRGNFYFFGGDTAALATAGGTPVRPRSAEEIEDAYWDGIRNSTEKTAFDDYLKEYPAGRYAPLARQRALALGPVTARPNPTPDPPTNPSVVTANNATPGGTFKDCADCPEMVVLPAGSFNMGDGAATDSSPTHTVTLKQFAIGKTEVTQAQWRSVMGNNPSFFATCGDTCPVERVSWDDAQQFIQRLNAKTGKAYRLPSESQWEYAARAGSTAAYSFGDDESQLGNHGWYSSNSRRLTHPVGQKRPNNWGLDDMHGNVSEWVEDCYHDNYNGAPTDGSAWITGCRGDFRVLRGGSWGNIPAILHSAYRFWYAPDDRNFVTGFRLVRTLVDP